MKKLTFIPPDQLLDALSSALFEAGALGLQEGVGSLITYVASEEEEQRLRLAVHELEASWGETQPDAQVLIECEEIDDSWQETWQNALEAVNLTPEWVLRPTHQAPAPKGEHTIWFQPEASFGDGSHPTTQLAAGATVQWLKGRAQLSAKSPAILDMGTGNGVLSLVALKEAERLALPLAPILAIDNDEVATRSFQQNMQLNALGDRHVDIVLGEINLVTADFDLILANINTPVLLEIGDQLANHLKPGASLIFTGLLVDDEPALRQKMATTDLVLVDVQRRGEWSLMHFERAASVT